MFTWFKRKKTPTASHNDGPLNDCPEEARRIDLLQRLCTHAKLSAEQVGEDRFESRPAKEWDHYEHKRYRRLRDEAIALVDSLSDDFYRSAALELLIELFMKAGDLDEAQTLFNNIKVDLFKQRVTARYPQLTLQRN